MPQNSELQLRQVPQPLGGMDAALFLVLAMPKFSAPIDANIIAGTSSPAKKRNSGRRQVP